MRSVTVILLTLAVIGGAFALYAWFQPPPAQRGDRATAPTTRAARPAATQSYRGVGRGDSPWIKTFENGELVSQFRGDSYDPQPGNIVKVTRPQAEFFTRDSRIRIDGAAGVVVVPPAVEEKPGRFQEDVPLQPPTRGTLSDVVISLFEPADASEPTLVARMNNAVFDNDHFRIATEGYTDEKGNRIEADQVPVTVRGRDYDFDGRGLTISWNVRDRRLQRLQIEHGEQLVVKDPANFGNVDVETPTSVRPATSPAVQASGEDVMLVSADPRPPVLLAAARQRRAAPPTSNDPLPASRPRGERDLSPVVYRATFENDVKIFEADKQIVAARQMFIDVMQSPPDDAATLPAGEETGPSTAATRRAARKSRTATTASTQGIRGPIVVKWTGKLRVVPLDGPIDPALAPNKAVVHMIGEPLLLTRDGTEARAGSAIYNSASASASLVASEEVAQVVMTDARGAKITTPRLDYSEAPSGQRFATLIGASRAEFPVESAAGASERVVATWAEHCRLHLADDGAGELSIHQADLRGAVDIQHPQLAMKAGELSLAFDPARARDATTASAAPTTALAKNVAATLREIIARGDVNCAITGERGRQTIAAQTLRVETDQTPDGKTYARLLNADGDVRTMEEGRELRAGRLVAQLAPATRPAGAPAATRPSDPLSGGDVRLVSLVASENVSLSSPDGARAAANALRVTTRPDGSEEYLLTGAPARVGDENSTVAGASIRFIPADKLAEIDGPGAINARQPDRPGEVFDITWGGGARVNGADDTIRVKQKVAVQSKQADGTINTATSDRLLAKLAPKPTTSPAPRDASKASTRPGDDIDFMSGKEIASATLEGSVEVRSELRGGDGALVRGMNLLAEQVNFDRATGRLDVPVAGRMLYQDHRPPDEKSLDDAAPTVGDGRGSTAFAWSKSLVYDPQALRAIMTGEVQVVHRPDPRAGDKPDPNADPFDLRGQTLIAEFAPRQEASGAAQTRPADPLAGGANLDLRRVTVRGAVSVKSRRLNLEALELSYDPVRQILTATGDADSPITVFDHEKGSSQTAREIEWNTKTDEFVIRGLTGKVRQ